MARLPAVDAATAHAAAAAIVTRRTDAPCPDLHRLDDSLDGVASHVARHGDTHRVPPSADVDPEVLRADVVDALAVLDYLDTYHRARLARLRLGVIAAGRRAGMGPTALAGPLHQTHRQGVDELVARLRALLDPTVGIADARAGRAEQLAAAADRERVDGHAAALVAWAEELVGLRDLVPATAADECGIDVDDLAYLVPDQPGDPVPGRPPGRAPAPGRRPRRLAGPRRTGARRDRSRRAPVQLGTGPNTPQVPAVARPAPVQERPAHAVDRATLAQPLDELGSGRATGDADVHALVAGDLVVAVI